MRGTDTLVISKASANHELVISKVVARLAGLARLAVGRWPLAVGGCGEGEGQGQSEGEGPMVNDQRSQQINY